MSTLFTWRDEYAYGLPEIDAQHRRLFELGAHAQTLVPARADNEAAAQLLAEMAASVQNHFHTEQMLMAEHGCPSLAAHQAEHDGLLEVLGGFSREFEAGRAEITVELLAMLDGWITRHLTVTDRIMADELATR